MESSESELEEVFPYIVSKRPPILDSLSWGQANLVKKYILQQTPEKIHELVNIEDDRGNTPVLILAERNELDHLKWFVEQGADIEVCVGGDGVMFWAEDHENKEMEAYYNKKCAEKRQEEFASASGPAFN